MTMEDIYNPTNRANIVKFLTKQFGFDRATHMYETRAIPPDACDTILKKVVVSTHSTRTPEIDWTDEGVLHSMQRYIQRTYNGKHVDVSDLTEYDIRMIYTMNKLQNSYNTHQVNRKKTILSTLNEIENTRYSRPPPQPKNMFVEKKAPPKQETCRAIKMNGEKCTAKTKNGTQFCCRHGKK